MRWLLIIPVLLLFLSHFPVKMEMKMPSPPVTVKEKPGCCKKNENRKTVCHKKDSPDPVSSSPLSSKDCPLQTGATCVCICFLQYTAPEQALNLFEFNMPDRDACYTGYIHQIRKDPLLPGPWQPPDILS